MKRSVLTLCNLLLSSTLLWALPSAEAEEMISGIPTDMTVYCHPASPTMPEDGFAWQLPVLDPLAATIVDFNSSCDYGLSGSEVSFPPVTEDFQESAKRTNGSDDFDNPKYAKGTVAP